MLSTDTVTRPRRHRWTRLAIILHWLTVLFVIAQLIDHDWMEDAFDAFQDGETPEPGVLNAARVHAVIGVLILLSTLARLWDRLARGRPPYPERTPVWAAWLSRANHLALFAILIIMPLAGAAAWFGGIEEAGDFHGSLWTVLLVLVALHVAGALTEHFVFRTEALRRMLGRETSRNEER